MINEKGLRNYRRLLYYKEKHIAVHFDLDTKHEWCNGTILDLDKEKLTLVLNEFKKGEYPILLEDINEESIEPYVNREEEMG